MSKVVWEFDMEEPRQVEDLQLRIKAVDLAIFVFDMENMFRNELKYNEELSEDTIEVLERMQSVMLENIEDRQIGDLIE